MSNNADMYGISKSKAGASWEKYASLFQKHVSSLENGSVCFISLGNVDVVFKLLENFKNCKVYIYDDDATCKSVELLAQANGLLQATQLETCSSDDILESIKECDMKFDCIIMNPPYSKNLHLKILAEAIKHLKDETSTCVNLSPVRWLQDPLAKYKKHSDYHRFEESVSKHIESLDIVTSEEGAAMFDNRLNIQCGVYCCKINNTFINDYSDAILDKLYLAFKNTTMKPYIQFSEPNKFACVVSLICGGAAGWTEKCPPIWMMSKEKSFYTNNKNYKGQTYKEYRDGIIWGNLKPKSEVTNVQFESEVERENFYSIWSTNVMKYIYKRSMVDVNVHPEFLPWLGDAVNPRTGLKGYQGEWTDEDLYTFFNLTPEEVKTIEDTMAKYK